MDVGKVFLILALSDELQGLDNVVTVQDGSVIPESHLNS